MCNNTGHILLELGSLVNLGQYAERSFSRHIGERLDVDHISITDGSGRDDSSLPRS